MIFKKMLKIIKTIYIVIFISISLTASANNNEFNTWLEEFKTNAVTSGFAQTTVNEFMSDVKFLPKVLEYDRYQPEFYEDTFTYIEKRANKNKVRKGLNLYKKEKIIILIIFLIIIIELY